MKVHFTKISANSKVGPIPVSMTERASCPDRCSLKGAGCYADLGHLGFHWTNVADKGLEWEEFCRKISMLPTDQLWRHNVAGDLPGNGKLISRSRLRALVKANRFRFGFTYTHYTPWIQHNLNAIKRANQDGFTINLSADSIEEADKLWSLAVGVPVVVVLPSHVTKPFLTPRGRQVIVCPATQHDNITCATCRICSHNHREAVVGFPAHGARKKVIDIRLAT